MFGNPALDVQNGASEQNRVQNHGWYQKTNKTKCSEALLPNKIVFRNPLLLNIWGVRNTVFLIIPLSEKNELLKHVSKNYLGFGGGGKGPGPPLGEIAPPDPLRPLPTPRPCPRPKSSLWA